MTWIVDTDQTTKLLSEMVAIDSVNPDLVPGAAGEKVIADWFFETCNQLGLDTWMQEAAPNRPNVIAKWPGQSSEKSLLLTGHTDVVAVEGMTIDPFVPKIEDGRLYGRGSFDMKGGLASILGAVAALKSGGYQPQGDLYLGFVADEEYASIGTEALVKEIQPGAAILTEPTDLDICIAHKGFVWLTLTTHGRTAHGSSFDAGVDAIAHMGHLVQALQHMDDSFQSIHDLLSRPSVHASAIKGGIGWSTYPDRCELKLEHRMLPHQSAEQIVSEWQSIINQLKADVANFDAEVKLAFSRPAYEIERDAPIVSSLHQSFVEVMNKSPSYMGTSGWLDSAILGAAGIPTVIIGPGGDGAHAAVEYVILDDVFRCADILAQTTSTYLG